MHVGITAFFLRRTDCTTDLCSVGFCLWISEQELCDFLRPRVHNCSLPNNSFPQPPSAPPPVTPPPTSPCELQACYRDAPRDCRYEMCVCRRHDRETRSAQTRKNEEDASNFSASAFLTLPLSFLHYSCLISVRYDRSMAIPHRWSGSFKYPATLYWNGPSQPYIYLLLWSVSQRNCFSLRERLTWMVMIILYLYQWSL